MTVNIKVCSYNIHKGFDARNKAFVLPLISESLKKMRLDIAFLQEVQGKHSARRLKKVNDIREPQIEYLSHDYWPYFIYGKNAVYGDAHHGNGLLSQFPFISWNNIDVSFAARASRSLLHGIIKLPSNERLHVICIHLGLFRMEREIQLKILCQTIINNIANNEPLIIAGDFNDWRKRAHNQLEKILELKEVYMELNGEHAKTYPAKRPAFAIDRIYYRGLKLKKGHVLSGDPWQYLSDHLPLCAEFELI